MKIIAVLIVLWAFGIGIAQYREALNKQKTLADLIAHQSKVMWQNDQNPTTRLMEIATRQKISADYTNAWKQQSICWQTNDSTGLYAYFVPFLREKIEKNASDLRQKQVSIVQKDLQHHLQLQFYSLDGQVVSMTDSVTVFQQIDAVQQSAVRRYDVLLLLEEGHWRVKNWVWK
jgi:hypothetical protein